MQLGVDSKLVAHGLLMWIAWILLLPAAIGALRFAVLSFNINAHHVVATPFASAKTERLCGGWGISGGMCILDRMQVHPARCTIAQGWREAPLARKSHVRLRFQPCFIAGSV